MIVARDGDGGRYRDRIPWTYRDLPHTSHTPYFLPPAIMVGPSPVYNNY